jgi:hypothetical protein
MLGRLRTRDRLRFIETETHCVLCRHHDDNHSHQLFFACNWTSILWRKIRAWLRMNRRMATLNSATRGLSTRKKNLEARMRRVSLSITVYLIWEERNKRIFDNTYNLVELIYRKFQVFFYMILHFHEKNHLIFNIGWRLRNWLVRQVCWLDSLPSYHLIITELHLPCYGTSVIRIPDDCLSCVMLLCWVEASSFSCYIIL